MISKTAFPKSGQPARQVFHQAAAGALAGAAASLLPALGARGAMALITLADGSQPAFSIGGTGLIMIFGAAIGAFLGMFYVLMKNSLPCSGTLWCGLLYGAVIFVMFGIPYSLHQPQGTLIVAPASVQIVYYLLPFAYALTLAAIYGRAERAIPPFEWNQHKALVIPVYGPSLILMLMGIAAIVLVVLIFGLVGLLRPLGWPLFRYFFNHQLISITPVFAAAVVLLLSFPALFSLGLLIPLRRLIPGPPRLKGLILGVLLALIVVLPAYLITTAGLASVRIPTLGAGVAAIAVIVSSGVGGWALLPADQTRLPDSRGVLVLAAITISAYLVVALAGG